MKVSFDGIGETAATFRSEGVCAGQPVKIGENAKVVPAQAGEDFVGVVLSAGAEYACVQIGGCVSIAYSGGAPALGFTALAADGGGGVAAGSGGREYAVLAAADGKVTIIL